MKLKFPPLSFLLVVVLPLVSQASPLTDKAIAFWDFEGSLAGSNSRDIKLVASTEPALESAVSPVFQPVTDLSAKEKQGLELDGNSALKSNASELRLPGAQTFWIRFKLSSMPRETVALMNRSRPVDTQRGISLEVTNGKLGGFISTDGARYDTQLSNSSGYTLRPDRWYDVSLRFDPTNLLRIDIYDPESGELLDSLEQSDNVAPEISVSKGIGSGYFQVGAINHGSSGSSYLMPGGSVIAAAGVWDFYLTDQEIEDLSSGK